MIDEKFYLDKKLLAMTKKEIKSYRMKKPLCSQETLFVNFIHALAILARPTFRTVYHKK